MLTIGALITVTGSAQAAAQVDCASGPPTPIALQTGPGEFECFGGEPGVESIGTYIEGGNGGGYYGRLYVTNGGMCLPTVLFYPGETFYVGAVVCALQIDPIPPF